MTVKPTDNVVRMIELKARDDLLEAKLEARRVRREYVAALRSLSQFDADPDAVEVADTYRQLIIRLEAIEKLDPQCECSGERCPAPKAGHGVRK